MLINFEFKYQMYSTMLFKLCVLMLKNKEDAEEATQDAFVKLLHKAPKFKDLEYEKAWLIRITINICKDILKSSWKQKRDNINDFNEKVFESKEPKFLDEILELPYKYRAVLYLHYYEGYNTNEISKILGPRPSSIRSQLLRARQMLKMEIEGGEE